MEGVWTEEESQEKLKEHVRVLNQRLPNARMKRLEKRVLEFERVTKRKLRNPDELHEREYYFDEGYGVSLKKHIAQLKENMPNVHIETRKDKDGFTIIKQKWKKQYKYDLRMLNKEAGFDEREIYESVLQVMMGGSEEPNKEGLMNIILSKKLHKFNLDAESKQKFESLIKKRVSG